MGLYCYLLQQWNTSVSSCAITNRRSHFQAAAPLTRPPGTRYLQVNSLFLRNPVTIHQPQIMKSDGHFLSSLLHAHMAGKTPLLCEHMLLQICTHTVNATLLYRNLVRTVPPPFVYTCNLLLFVSWRFRVRVVGVIILQAHFWRYISTWKIYCVSA